jgi:hypothetical protein
MFMFSIPVKTAQGDPYPRDLRLQGCGVRVSSDFQGVALFFRCSRSSRTLLWPKPPSPRCFCAIEARRFWRSARSRVALAVRLFSLLSIASGLVLLAMGWYIQRERTVGHDRTTELNNLTASATRDLAELQKRVASLAQKHLVDGGFGKSRVLENLLHVKKRATP